MGYGTSSYASAPYAGSATAGEGVPVAALTGSATAASTVDSEMIAALRSFLSASDSLSGRDIASLRDAVTAVDNLQTSAELYNALLAMGASSDGMRVVFTQLLTSAGTASEALLVVYRQFEQLRARALAYDPMASSAVLARDLVSEALVLDLLSIGYDAEALAAGAVSEVVMDARLRAVSALLADAEAAAALDNSVIAVAELSDSADVTIALDAAASFAAFLDSGGTAVVNLRLAGEEYSAWVMNMDSLGVTQYQNYGFNSFAKFNRFYYGAREDGLYLLDGDTDDGTPIQAWIKTGLSNFGTGLVKRMPAFYIGYTADNGMVLKVTVTNAGEKTEHWYKLTPRQADSTREDRATVGKGLASVYWQWELHNIDGGDFEIDTMRFWPMVLTRRVR